MLVLDLEGVHHDPELGRDSIETTGSRELVTTRFAKGQVEGHVARGVGRSGRSRPIQNDGVGYPIQSPQA